MPGVLDAGLSIRSLPGDHRQHHIRQSLQDAESDAAIWQRQVSPSWFQEHKPSPDPCFSSTKAEIYYHCTNIGMFDSFAL